MSTRLDHCQYTLTIPNIPGKVSKTIEGMEAHSSSKRDLDGQLEPDRRQSGVLNNMRGRKDLSTSHVRYGKIGERPNVEHWSTICEHRVLHGDLFYLQPLAATPVIRVKPDNTHVNWGWYTVKCGLLGRRLLCSLRSFNASPSESSVVGAFELVA